FAMPSYPGTAIRAIYSDSSGACPRTFAAGELPQTSPCERRKTEKRLRRIDASASGTERPATYCAASLPDFWAARSRSKTERQPVLRSERCFIMQAVIFGIFGISELQSRNASPVHCCCASELKAKLAVDETAENEAAKASARVILRAVAVNSVVIVGSHWPGVAG